jgi:hypothetical protein
MFHRGDFAVGNVRIPGDLRRRRNGNGSRNHDACHRGNAGQRGDIGNIDVIGNLGDIRSVDIFRNVGDVGIVGNVRLRLEQHCCIVEPNVSVAHYLERQRSGGNSVGVL